ncbi:cytosine permease [Candidatus Pelagibacter sp. HIMB1321]|uniref:cytosine permease n=1 Tax=Candidatus Pelagibacter sp. HIMB1321 TaxID=1388755 RepID=UPI000A07F237|nr:cytosine permease [Candidatus Pelagibacter sp. HIMB1321]SMF74031.1 nucleobase:cation symporter-1, NCS1 family [Candidatus Pelagibacter sp. HIMB1321]
MSQKKSAENIINWELVAINPNNKVWNWKDLFYFWGVNVQSVIGFSLIASLYTIYSLNFFVVFFGTLLGSLLVYFFSNLIGKPSQKYGLPFATILRTSLGYGGARFFGFMRSIVGIFMFGIQTYFISKAISYLIRILIFSIDNSFLDKDIFLIFLLGLNIIDWFSLIMSIIFQTYLFSKGMVFNKKLIKISAISVYSGMIIFFGIVLFSDTKLAINAFVQILDFKNFINLNNFFPLITVAGTIFAYFSIIIVSYGDFSRYVKNEKQLSYGNISLLINLIIFSFFAVFIVTGSDVFLNQQFEDIDRIFTNPTDIIGKLNNLQITTIVLFFIIIASASTNLVANLIPSQYSLINFKPGKLNLKSASYTIGLLGFIVALLWPTLLSQVGILSFVDTFGSFFGPICGVMIINYFVINHSKINIKDIHLASSKSSFHFSNGWDIKALYSILIGFIFSSSTIWNLNLMFLQSYAWIIGALFSSLTYYLLKKN